MATPQPVESATMRAHRRQLAWQILVPFFVVMVVILFVAVMVATGAITTRTWADVSTIWMLAPMLVFALLFVVVLGFLIFGIAKLLQVLPRYTGKTQDIFARLSGLARIIADGAAKPIVWLQQAGAIFKQIFRM